MFDHVTFRASDLEASVHFYDTVLAVLGIEQRGSDDEYKQWRDFSVAQAHEGKPVTRGVHVGFVARSHEQVDEFWRVGTAAGYESDGEPGPRPEYREDYYGSFLLDPDGNSAEAVWHGELRTGGFVDHVWLRVADVAAAKAFYEQVAPHAGFHLGRDTPERASFDGDSGSFSLVAGGRPSENLHLAFPAGADSVVDDFHAALVADGYRDDGAPGERAIYHPGYYGAFVLDPDGNSVELVNHNR